LVYTQHGANTTWKSPQDSHTHTHHAKAYTRRHPEKPACALTACWESLPGSELPAEGVRAAAGLKQHNPVCGSCGVATQHNSAAWQTAAPQQQHSHQDALKTGKSNTPPTARLHITTNKSTVCNNQTSWRQPPTQHTHRHGVPTARSACKNTQGPTTQVFKHSAAFRPMSQSHSTPQHSTACRLTHK
jgi:hypothetical protein